MDSWVLRCTIVLDVYIFFIFVGMTRAYSHESSQMTPWEKNLQGESESRVININWWFESVRLESSPSLRVSKFNKNLLSFGRKWMKTALEHTVHDSRVASQDSPRLRRSRSRLFTYEAWLKTNLLTGNLAKQTHNHSDRQNGKRRTRTLGVGGA